MLSIFTIIVTENIKGFFIVTYVISLFSESIVDLSPLETTNSTEFVVGGGWWCHSNLSCVGLIWAVTKNGQGIKI